MLLLLCLPWAILVTVATDGEFLANAIKSDFLAKVEASQESHGAPPGVYALLIGLLIWPASPLLVWAFTNVRTFAASAETRFLLAWIIPFWFMIELTPTKLPHYPLPLFPAIILLLIGGADCAVRSEKIGTKWQYFVGVAFRYLGVGTGLLLASIVLFFAFEYGGVTSRQAILFALLAFVMASIAAWYGHQWIRQALWRPFFNMIGAALLFHLIVFAGVVPALSQIHVSSAIAKQIAALPTKPSAIAATGYQEPSLVFLLGRNLLLLGASEAALFLIEAPGGLAIIEQRQQDAFLQAAGQLGFALPRQFNCQGLIYQKARM